MIRMEGATSQVGLQNQARALEAWGQLISRRDLGFLDLPHRANLWEISQERSREIRSNYKTLAILGIGGSSLGARAIQDALSRGDSARLLFFENVDAVRFWSRLEGLKNLDSVHWLIISKSGQTMETLFQASMVQQYLAERGLSLESRATVMTELKPSSLFMWAQKNEIPILEIPKDVGGRFSVLTPVGLVPAAFSGVDIKELRSGALWALDQKSLVIELSAHVLESIDRDQSLTFFWFYSDALATFGLWLQQLWSESLAKKQDRFGNPGPRVSFPVPLIGANDQHSVLQQLMESRSDKSVWFVGVDDSESFGPQLFNTPFGNESWMNGQGLGMLLAAEMRATQKALTTSKVDSLTLKLKTVGPKEMGAFIMLMELVIGTLGEALNIDAYNQPGVELGKRLARDILTQSKL